MAEPRDFFTSTWGRLRLYCALVSTDNSRRLIVHDLTSGDDHPVQDVGMSPRTTRCSLLFDDFEGERLSPIERFRQLKAAVDSGAEAMLQHPIEGSFLARVGNFTYDIDECSVIGNVSIEFIPTTGIEAVSPAGAGTLGVIGEAAVTQAAADLDAALAAVGIDLADLGFDESPTDLGRASVETWSEGEEVPTRQVIVDTANISDRLSTMIDELGLEDDLELWDVYYSTIMFGNAMRSAAISATTETPAVFVLHVQTPVALLPLMARIYGGAEAEDRERQVRELNDVRTPGWFGPGDLLLPIKSRARSVF